MHVAQKWIAEKIWSVALRALRTQGQRSKVDSDFRADAVALSPQFIHRSEAGF
jgi:hypothetical protein